MEPLTPSDCDLRGLPFMPLDTARLLDSDLFALATAEEFRAALTLWCKAWLQVPAASLPSDDRILAHLSGAGTRWKKIKAVALRGFELCSDGRLYHAVVAEKAMDAWERRGEWQEKQDNKNARQQRWRERVKELSKQLRDLGVTPPSNAPLSTLETLLASTVDAIETEKRRLRQGQGQGHIPLPNGNGAEADSDRQFWDGAKSYLGKSKSSMIGKWCSQYGQPDTAKAIAAAQIARAFDPIAYIEKTLRDAHVESAEFAGPC